MPTKKVKIIKNPDIRLPHIAIYWVLGTKPVCRCFRYERCRRYSTTINGTTVQMHRNIINVDFKLFIS